MAEDADYGLMIWDGKSPGTMNNIIELLQRGKKALVYLSPKKRFFTVASLNDTEELLANCAPEDIERIAKKTGLVARLKEATRPSQYVLDF